MQNEQYREMMTVGNVDQLMALFGPHDENVDLVRRETGAEIFAHGDEITLSGEEEAVRLAHLVLDKLLAILAGRASTAPASATPSTWRARATPTALRRSCRA